VHFKFQIPASVISSVGTVNYHHQYSQSQQQQQHQLIFVSPFSKPGTSNNSTTVQTLPIVLSTSSTSSSNCNNNNQQVDGNVKIKMIQQTTNVQHPRLHPKKRKFDLAELEDDVQTTSSSNNACNNQQQQQQQQDINTQQTQKSSLEQNRPVANVQNLNGNGTHVDAENHNNSTDAIASNSQQQQQQQQYLKVVPDFKQHFTKKPFSTSSYSPSCLPSVASTATSSHQQITTTAPVDQADLVDLKEWTNHNVLAKRKDIYYPGIIAGSTLPCSVIVAFRHPENQQQIFQDIFSNGLYDVISDRVPSIKEVSFKSIFQLNYYFLT
jgi:hypothetical protein